MSDHAPHKFRVWDGEEMHEPPHDWYIGSQGLLWRHDGTLLSESDDECWVPSTFTGLTDAEGREIWEGDWFQADNLYRPRCVMWSDADAGCKLIDPRGVLRKKPVTLLGEVIGNRYNNPEMMEEVSV